MVGRKSSKMWQRSVTFSFVLVSTLWRCAFALEEPELLQRAGSHHEASRPSAREIFSEELLLRPLPDGKILAHFHFTNQLLPHKHHHMQSFPKSIDQLVRQSRIREMELSFTQGRWDHRRWGSADSLVAANGKAPGVELWAWFGTPPHQVDAAWRNLTHTLSGLFCASLNFLESAAITAAPQMFFRPDMDGQDATAAPASGTQRQTEASTQATGRARTHAHREPSTEAWGLGFRQEGPVRYGALAREAVCTENLTPWLKLLPCRDKAGLATLLDRPSVYGGPYHSMRIHLQAGEGAEYSLPRAITLRQTLTLVLAPPGKHSKGGRPGGGSREPVKLPDWSVSSLFGRGLAEACPLAGVSRVYLELEGTLVEKAGVAPAPRLDRKDPYGVEKEEGDAKTPTAAESAEGEGSANERRPPRHQTSLWDNSFFQVTPAPCATLERRSLTVCGLTQGLSGEGSGSVLLRFDVRNATKSRTPGEKMGRSGPLDVGLVWKAPIWWSPPVAPYRVQRFVTGHGNENGGITIALRANREQGRGTVSQSSCGLIKGSEESMEREGAEGDMGERAVAEVAAEGSEARSEKGRPETEEEGNFFDFSDYEEQGWRTFAESDMESEAPEPEGSSKWGSEEREPRAGTVSGSGLASGEGVDVLVFQVVPWFVRLYLHTLELWLDGRQVAVWEWLRRAHIVPAEDRESPATFELELTLPRNVTNVVLSVEFDKGYLYVDEHPSDASRGMDLPPALVIFPTPSTQPPPWTANGLRLDAADSPMLEQLQRWRGPRVYTEALVVPLPLPDFSMPYNVITLTGTVLAMFFGSLLNVLRRRPGHEAVRRGARVLGGSTSLLHRLSRIPKPLRVVLLVGLGGVAMKYLEMF